MKSQCPHCGVPFEVTGKIRGTTAKCPKCGIEIKFAEGCREYKVLSQKMLCGDEVFDPEVIERKLNKLSAQGWRVVSSSTVDVIGFSGRHNDAMIILEREL